VRPFEACFAGAPVEPTEQALSVCLDSEGGHRAVRVYTRLHRPGGAWCLGGDEISVEANFAPRREQTLPTPDKN
jgi:hypothetical protein